MKRRHLEVLHGLLIKDKNHEFRIAVGLSKDKGAYVRMVVGYIYLEGNKVPLPEGTKLYKDGIEFYLKQDVPFNVNVKCSNLSYSTSKYKPEVLQALSFFPVIKEQGEKTLSKRPTIKPSGKTYVANYQDVDYLCMNPEYYKDVKPGTNLNCILEELQQVSLWKDIRDIKITDEIAKLRPMVNIYYYDNKESCRMLVYIDGTYIQAKGVSYVNSAGYSIKLATVEDLNK